MILHGDSLKELAKLDANSVDAVVTDPPYGLAFMGKKWDYDVPSVELWREVFRVMKPGAHLLSFGGTRTYHRMVVAIEDAGFEIRDQVAWLYGSGFPKSLDVSKAIDKAAGAEPTKVGEGYKVPNIKNNNYARAHDRGTEIHFATTATTATAKQWQGWGTALKPANEPIVLARKPLEKGLTVAENVLKWGVGAINVDAGRIGSETIKTCAKEKGSSFTSVGNAQGFNGCAENFHQGRWPANVLLDEEAAAMLDEQSLAGGMHGAGRSRGKGLSKQTNDGAMFGVGNHEGNGVRFGDSGGASRFFYVAKTSKRERNAGLEGMAAVVRNDGRDESLKSGDVPMNRSNNAKQNFHPTVKPIKLMEYLCKLITPAGGVILDPFLGSGSTGCAAVKLGFKFIGIEREAEYVEIARKRIEHWQKAGA